MRRPCAGRLGYALKRDHPIAMAPAAVTPYLHSRTRIDMRWFIPLVLVAAVAAPTPAESHRELGAHVHGRGTLDIAIEGQRVAMELEAPGMDIVGFERQPKSNADKAAVERVTKLLKEPLALFKLPEAAGCTLVDAKVELKVEADKAEDKKPAEGKKGGHSHAHGHGHSHDHSQHTAFRATYQLACADPAKITSIAFDYFKRFTGAKSLAVNVVSGAGQKSYEVKRAKPTLALEGVAAR